MKNTILAFLVSRGGSIASPIIAAIVAYLVGQLAMLAPEVAAQVNQAELTAWVWGLILALINYATNATPTDGVKEIQAAAQAVQQQAPALVVGQRAVDVDGVPGPITTAVVTDLLGKLLPKK